MPLPNGVTTFTLSNTELDATGAPANVGLRGSLTPVDATGTPIRIVHLASGQEIVPTEITFTIATDGTWSVGPLPYTDQSGLSAVGYQYRVQWNTPHWRASPGDKTFSVPSGTTSPVLYSSLGPAPTAPTVLVPAPHGLPAGGASGQALVKASATDYDATWSTLSGTGGTVPDATATVKGIVQLAGDLAGIAAAPTVPGLAAKVATTDPRLSDTRTPTDGSVTDIKVATGAAINADKLADGTALKVLTAAERTKLAGIATGATAYTDEQAQDAVAAAIAAGTQTGVSVSYNDAANSLSFTATGTTSPDATTTSKGIVQLAGDLGGTAAAPTVPGLAAKLDTTTAAATYVAKVNAIDLEGVEDDVAGMFTGGTHSGISFAYDDPAGHLNATVTPTFTPTATKTGAYSAVDGDLVVADATSAGFTVTLPTPTAARHIAVRKIDSSANAVTVTASSGTIDGSASRPHATQWQTQVYIADGTNWQRLVVPGVSALAATGTASSTTFLRGDGSWSAPASDPTKANVTVTQTTQTGTTYTLVLADAGTLVESNNASAVTLTVPPNSSVAFAVGTSIVVRQYGAGQVAITPGAAVTIRSRGALTHTAGQYAEATLTKRATDEWLLSGDIA